MRITNVVKNFFNLLKKGRSAVMAGMILCALGGGAWATNYVYNGTWSPSEPVFASLIANDTVTFKTTPPAYEGLTIPADVTVSVYSGVTLTIQNNPLVINGTLINKGTVDAKQQFQISSTGKLQNKGGATFQNNGISSNAGIIINEGNFTSEGGLFTNTGTITNSLNATFSANNGLTNSGSVTNDGIFSISGATFTNDTGSTFINNGTLSGTNGITNNGTLNTTSGIINGTVSGTTPVGTATNNYTYTGPQNGDWITPEYWTPNSVPDVSGASSTKIVLENDCYSSYAITINNSGENEITILLNGHNLSFNDFLLFASDGGILSDTHKSTLNIIGPGNVTVDSIDTCKNNDCFLNLSRNVTFTVKNSIALDLGNSNWFTVEDKDGSCTLYLPASGVDINYGDSRLKCVNITPKPYGVATIFSVEKDSASPFNGNSGSGTGFTFKKTVNDSIMGKDIDFDYTFTATPADKWTFNGSSASSGTVTIGKGDTTKSVYAKCSKDSLDAGEGYILTVKTPDRSMVLAEFRYIQGEITWVGPPGGNFLELSNWKIGETTVTDSDLWTHSTLVIPGNSTPVFAANSEPTAYPAIGIKKLIIQNGAKLSITTGTTSSSRYISVEGEIECKGTGCIDASSGTVLFSGTTSTFKADYPELSSFGNVRIDNSSTFQPQSAMYISGTFDNSGGGTYDAVTYSVTTYFTDSTAISGNASDETKTKFHILNAENLGGKTLSFTNEISANKLILSGTSPSSLLTINGGGTITLSTTQTDGEYLDLTDSGLPSLTKLFTVTNSHFPAGASQPYLNWMDGDFSPSYSWTGAASTDWNTPGNWSSGSVPPTGEIITIPAGCTFYPKLTADLDLLTGSLIIEQSAKIDLAGNSLSCNDFTLDGIIALTGTETITVTGTKTLGTTYQIEFNSAGSKFTSAINTFFGSPVNSILVTKDSDVTLDDNLEVSSITNGGIITVPSGKTLTLSGTYSDSTPAGATDHPLIVLTGGTLASTSLTELSAMVKLDKTTDSTIDGGTAGFILSDFITFSPETQGKLVAKGKLSLAGTLISLTLDSSADITFTDLVTITDTWDNQSGGTLNQNGNNLIFSAYTPATYITIKGSNTFSDIKLQSDTYFEDGTTTTITNSISASSVQLLSLTLGNTWTLTTTGATTSFSSIKVQDSISTEQIVVEYPSCEDLGNNTNWIFKNQPYTWTPQTTNPNDWSTKENWTPSSIPSDYSVITIEDGKASYPVLTTAISLPNASITIEENSKIDLAGNSIEYNNFSLAGTIALTGSETITVNNTKSLGSTYQIEYNTTGTVFTQANAEFFNISTTTPLNKLIITSGADLSFDSSITSALIINSIENAGTLKANNKDFTISGTWDNTAGGTFVPGTGAAGETVTQTVTFKGANATISGNSSFNNIIFANGTKGEISSSLTVASTTQILNGTGNELKLTNPANLFTNGVKIGDYDSVAEITTYAGPLTLAGTGSSSAPIKIIADAYADRFTFENPVELLGNAKATYTQTYNNTVAINSSSILTAMSATFAGNVTGESGTSLTVNSPTVIKGNITISPDTITFNNTINDDSTTPGTHTLTIDAGTGASPSVTFNSTIGASSKLAALTINRSANINSSASSINATTQNYNTLNVNMSTEFTGEGTITFTDDIMGAVGTTLTVKNANSTWGPNASSTNISVATLDKIIIINNTATNYSLDLSKATIPATLPFEFKGNSTTPAEGKINFTPAAPASQTYGHILVSDNANLNFTDDFKQPENNSISASFEIDNANVTVGTTAFIIDYLKVTNNGHFTQTGNNGNDSTAPSTHVQSVYRMENHVTNGIIWDNGNTDPENGGSLIIKHGIIVDATTKTIIYNYKKIDIYANELTLEGTFWNLIIPSGVTVKNSNYICVRNNFIIEDDGYYIHNDMPLYLGTDRDNPGLASSSAGFFKDENTTTTNNLGDVTINANGVTKTTTTPSNFLCTNLTITSGTTFTPDSNFDIEITNDFTDNGTLNLGTGKKISFNGTTPSVISTTRTTAYPYISIQKEDSDNSTTFDTAIIIDTLDDSTNQKGNIIFKNNTTVTNAVTFNTTGTVTFGDSSNTPTTYTFTNGVEHTAGNTIIASDTTVISATGTTANLTFDTISGTATPPTQNLELRSDSEITIGQTDLNTLSFSKTTTAPKIYIFGNITTQTSLTLPFETYFVAPGLQVKAPNLILPDSITVYINNTTFDAYTLLNSSLDVTTSGTDKLTITNDCVINNLSSPAVQNIATLACNKNLVLYNGKLQAQKNITVKNDLLLYGPAYNTKDQKSQIEGIYTYQNCLNNQNFTKTTLPDGSVLPTTYSGSLTTNDSIIISSANLYANGITATSNGSLPWRLLLNSNKNSETNFAEAYYCNFSASLCSVDCNDTNASDDAVKIAAEACTVNASYETGWDLNDFEITEAYTVFDNIVRIQFNRKLRITEHSDLYNSLNVGRIQYSSTSDGHTKTPYQHAYSTDNHSALTTPTDTIFLCGSLDPVNSGAWNSDATGLSSGRSGSKDSHGSSHTSIPYLDIPRNATTDNTTTGPIAYASFITDEYGKRLLHYYSTTPDMTAEKHENGYTYTNVLDHCKPVLLGVRTGQELHKVYAPAEPEGGQHSYDSHNYIEFLYSESVNIGTTDTAYDCDIYIPAYDPGTGAINVVENIPVTSKLGAVVNPEQEDDVEFAGIGKITKGKIHTAKNGVTDPYVNTFYRDNPFSIKISIAGLTNGTVTDKNGYDFKHWEGYIEDAITPSGNFLIKKDAGEPASLIFDLKGNTVRPATDTIPVNNSADSGTYGPWDTTSPSFAVTNLKQVPSSKGGWDPETYAEALGVNSGSVLNRIEFHLFDNKPDYTSTTEPYWFTQRGWFKAGTTDLVIGDSYSADIFGGSRPFATTNRTTGGIRFSTKAENIAAFKYTRYVGTTPTTLFKDNITSVYPTSDNKFFTGSSNTRRSADDPDGLYFGYEIVETDLPLNTTFSVSYDDQAGYVTDLAGNRLRTETINTIDRTPPSINFCLNPINKDEIFVVFVKQLETDSANIKLQDNGTGDVHSIPDTFADLLPKCFEIIEIDSTGMATRSTDLQLTTTPGKYQIFTSASAAQTDFTFITLKLNRPVTIEDLQKYHIRVIIPSGYPATSRDPITQIDNSNVTLIQDKIGNYIAVNSAHAISDFAIGAINPLYAYDTQMINGSELMMQDTYKDGSWAVYDFDEDQQNYGTLPGKHEYSLITNVDFGEAPNASTPTTYRMYISNAPDAASVSTQINKDFNTKLRLWFPSIPNSVFAGVSPYTNSNFTAIDSNLITTSISDGLEFIIPQTLTSKWNDGQISFLFSILDSFNNPIRIYNSPFYDALNTKYNLSLSTAVPLYALRQKDAANPLSLDLWSFRVNSIDEQRGGVTILNNVINATNNEKVVIKVNLPTEGNLNVMVMTLDGNIIQYLNHGQTTAGEHYYSWTGKNKDGSEVARGMYFVRVVGNGIDETRKVMVVK